MAARAPFERTADLHTDWISQLRRVLHVTDSQVRALRRRDLIDRLSDGNRAGDEAKIVADQAFARIGAYWGIDTDPVKLNPPNALACNPDTVRGLAHLATRLSDLGEQTSKKAHQLGLRDLRPQHPVKLQKIGVATRSGLAL